MCAYCRLVRTHLSGSWASCLAIAFMAAGSADALAGLAGGCVAFIPVCKVWFRGDRVSMLVHHGDRYAMMHGLRVAKRYQRPDMAGTLSIELITLLLSMESTPLSCCLSLGSFIMP